VRRVDRLVGGGQAVRIRQLINRSVMISDQ
jgi:hypothetical protein